MKQMTCKTCGKQFLQRSQEKYQSCRICNKKWCKEQEKIQEEADNLKRQEQRKRDREIFEKEILKYDPIPIESMKPSNRTLYIKKNITRGKLSISARYLYAFAEDLREMTGKAVDAFEISEINVGTPLYNAVMSEGKRIA